MYGIEKNASGGFTITGEGLDLYRMLALEGRLKMEAAGLRFSPSGRSVARQLYGLRGNRTNVLKALVALRHEHFPLSPD